MAAADDVPFPVRQARHDVQPHHTRRCVAYGGAAPKLEESTPLRLHALRHSFTTIARDELGLGDHVIARLVGHTLSGQTSPYGEVRDAMVRSSQQAGMRRTRPTEGPVVWRRLDRLSKPDIFEPTHLSCR